MSKLYADDSHIHFQSTSEMQTFHERLSMDSQWQRCSIRSLNIVPLTATSTLLTTPGSFAPGISEEAVQDTVMNLQLALRLDGQHYPLRNTAYKSLLDRAKLGGTVLNHLTRPEFCDVVNVCLSKHKAEALVLVRDEKVSAVHSGDSKDYSILPIDKLLSVLTKMLDDRFDGGEFQYGYSDHSITTANWSLPTKQNELLGTYSALLKANGSGMADKYVPGIRFATSDTGCASAKVAAMLMGGQCPIYVGSCVAVEHRGKATVEQFQESLDQLFAQFTDSIARLQHLMDVKLEYPVNAMTRICKKLSLPKKASLEAISMFDIVNNGNTPATAHDVYMAMQEIPYLLKIQNTSESKLLTVQETMARALTLRWSDYDLAKAVNY